jgi:dethiobiotin synthetase
LSPARGIFVTGTGTEVGKTVVAAAIARTLVADGSRVAVFKPAVTGLDEGLETDHALLRRASGSGQSDEEIAPYRYGPPASPHLAAALAGERIDPERLLATGGCWCLWRPATWSATSPSTSGIP